MTSSANISTSKLWWSLAREAGWRVMLVMAALAVLASLVEVAGLGLAVAVMFGPGGEDALLPRLEMPLRELLLALVLLMALRGLLQVGIFLLQDWLRSGLTDRLRLDLLRRVLYASSQRLDHVGRGELLGLLMSDINRSVMALDAGLRTLQSLIALLIYGGGVVLAGRGQAGALMLGLLAAALAGLLQRSGAWRLGQLHSRLNSSLQRTVGDGLHGLKAVRAACAEEWLMQRFADEAAEFRHIVRQVLARQSVFAALRDWLVVLVVALWLAYGRADLQPAALATLLLLAYRASGALGGLISSRRLCVGSLPGYDALRELRSRLGEPKPGSSSSLGARPLLSDAVLEQVCWQGHGPQTITLQPGALVALVGPSGSGKGTLLDLTAGHLAEESSHWWLQARGGLRLELEGSAGAAAWRSLVAYAHQGTVLFEGSLRDNLLLGSAVAAGQSDILLRGWLRRLGLEHLVERPSGLDGELNLAIDCFSGGEIQRLGLIRAWMQNRPVELLDEPTAFLDEQAATWVRQIVLERSRERLVLVATHDPKLMAKAAVVVQPARFERLAMEAPGL